MRSGLVATSLIVALSSLSADVLGKGNPSSCGPDVSVSVSFLPIDEMNVPYKITQGPSDPPYLAGFQVGNCSYDFTLNLFNSSPQIKVSLPGGDTTAWFFNFDRIGSVPKTDGGAQFLNWCQGPQQNPDGSFKTYVSDGKTIPFDSYAGCEIDGSGWFARRVVGFSLANDYALRFQVSPWEGQLGSAAVGTSYIKVYHPDDNTWRLEPEGPPAMSVLLDNSKKRSQPPAYQEMPFKAVVTRLLP